MLRPRRRDRHSSLLLVVAFLAKCGVGNGALSFESHNALTSGFRTPSRHLLDVRDSGAETTMMEKDVHCRTSEPSKLSYRLQPSSDMLARVLRGGQTMRQRSNNAGDLEDEDEELGEAGLQDEGLEADGETPHYNEKAVEWMMQQLCMYQTRTALISRPLAAKGYKLKDIVPPPRGLICALSTEERRMDCRMYVEAEVGKKVVAPCKCKGTQKWISFSALNSERRKETAKWKNCPVCQGPIDYKLYEAHGGSLGKLISAILNKVAATRLALAAITGLALLLASPVLHYVMSRILTAGITWKRYRQTSYLFQLPLPLKIMLIRFFMKWATDRFLELEARVRQRLTEVESRVLESRLPVTVEDERAKLKGEVRNLEGEISRHVEDVDLTPESLYSTKEQTAEYCLEHERLQVEKSIVDVRLKESEETILGLKAACDAARRLERKSKDAQLAAEVKGADLERRLQERTELVHARTTREERTAADIKHQTTMIESQLKEVQSSLEVFRQTMAKQRSDRRDLDAERRRIQASTTCMESYARRVLQVNEDLMARGLGRRRRRMARRAGREGGTAHASVDEAEGAMGCPRVQELGKGEAHGELRGWRRSFDERADVSAGEEDTLRVARFGGNAVRSLRGLYERLGFSPLQGEGAPGTAPVSQSPAKREPWGRDDAPRVAWVEHGDIGGETVLSGTRDTEPATSCSCPESERSGDRKTTPWRRRLVENRRSKSVGSKRRGRRHDGIFVAASLDSCPGSLPISRVKDSRRWPRAVQRLKSLAKQMEREQSSLEERYKTVLHKTRPGSKSSRSDHHTAATFLVLAVGHSHPGLGLSFRSFLYISADCQAMSSLTSEGGDGQRYLDPGDLQSAIARLQGKRSQLEAVRGSLEALRVLARGAATLGPTALIRRQAAALRVLGSLSERVGFRL